MRDAEKRLSNRCLAFARSRARTCGTAPIASSSVRTTWPVTVIDDLSNRSSVEGDDRSATGHGLDHREREGFRLVTGEKECEVIAKKRCLYGLVDLAYEFYTWAKRWCYLAAEIDWIHTIDLGRRSSTVG